MQAGIAPKEDKDPHFDADLGGYVYPPTEQNPQGRFVAVAGAKKEKSAAEKAPSEGERKAATLLMRLEGSQKQLNTALQENPEASKPGLLASGLRGVGLESAANTMATGSERQRVEAAQEDILDAALTLGTGAAYTKEQLRGYAKSYFPQIGDTPENIADKKDRLANVIQAAKIAAGRSAQGVADEFAIREKHSQPQNNQAPKTGERIGGYMFLGGNPADPNRWRKQ